MSGSSSSSSSTPSSSSAGSSDECTMLFEQMKENSAFLYIVYMVDKENKIVVERTSPILMFPNPVSITLSSHPWSQFQSEAIYLPSPVLADIFSLLPPRDLLNIITVCSFWKDVLAQHSLSIWQNVAFRTLCASPSPPFSLELTKHTSWRDFVLQRNLEKVSPAQMWENFVETLPNDQCRYIAYCMRKGENRDPYYTFIFWSPTVNWLSWKLKNNSNLEKYFPKIIQEVDKIESVLTRKGLLNFRKKIFGH